MNSEIIKNLNTLEVGDKISTFYKNGLYAGNITQINDNTIQLNNKTILKKEYIFLAKRFTQVKEG